MSWMCSHGPCRRFVPDSQDICPWCGSVRPGVWKRLTLRWHALKRGMMPAKTASLVATAAVLLGFGDLPYAYYTLLRLFLSGVSLFLMFGAQLLLADWQRWVLGGFAVLYNPLLPVQLGEKELWAVLNILTVIVFWKVSGQQRV